MKSLAVLVVDDQPIMREVVSQIVEDAGHRAGVACDGFEALRMLGGAPYDVLVTDIVMPGLDGIALIVETRRRYPEVRIVAMSAGSCVSSKTNWFATAERVGAGAVLRKPFHADELVTAIEGLCATASFALP